MKLVFRILSKINLIMKTLSFKKCIENLKEVLRTKSLEGKLLEHNKINE